MEKIILGGIKTHQNHNPVIGLFMRGKSCLSNLISFYERIPDLLDQGNAADVTILDFSKAFDSASYSILLEKLSSPQLDEHVL